LASDVHFYAAEPIGQLRQCFIWFDDAPLCLTYSVLRKSGGGKRARPGGEFRSGRGSQQRDQLNAIRETLEQLEGGSPLIDV